MPAQIFSPIYVRVELGGVGLGVVGGEFGGFIDHGARLGVYFFQLVFARPVLGQQPRQVDVHPDQLAAAVLEVPRRIGAAGADRQPAVGSP